MATVTPNNLRLDDAESITGWSGIGGGQGPSAEPSFPYQGGNLVNRKVTSTGGLSYNPASDGGVSRDMTLGAEAHWMVKAIVTDYAGLNGLAGAHVRMGSSSTAYHQFVIAGTDSSVDSYDNYPPRGGLITVPVNPNVVGYRQTTSGSPDLTAVDYFGLYVDFDNSSAKSENVGCDAIDLGTGLTLTGTGGSWADFVNEDEGVPNNRWGYASSIYGGAVNLFFGTFTLNGAFFDTTSQNIWPDGLFASGFSGVVADLDNVSGNITDGSIHTSLGTSSVEDTRADFTWQGTTHSGTASHTLNNFRNYSLSSSTILSGNIEVVSLVQGGGTIDGATIRCNSLASQAVMVDPSFNLISGTLFDQRGQGHAIEITTPGTYNLDQLNFIGFSADGTPGAAVFNNSGGAVTLNILGGATPTVRNSSGSTTTAANSVSVTFTNLVVGSRLYLIASSTVGNIPAGTVLINEEVTSSSFTYAHNFEGDLPVQYRVRKSSSPPYYRPVQSTGVIQASGLSVVINQTLDE